MKSLAILTSLAAVLLAGCRKPAAPELPPPVVQVATVTATNVPFSAEVIGQLDSPQNVEVRARVEAFVEKILFVDGSEVNEGQPLFQLDRKPFLERLAAAEGALAEARAALNKNEKDVARLKPLADKHAIPQQDLDNAVAAVAVGEANVTSVEARVAAARLDLGYCDVNAPVHGLIGAAQVTEGSLVGKGQPTLLATISKLNPIWVYCAISEVEYLRAQRRAQEHGRQLGELPVHLILADGSELPTPGKWVFLDRAVDATTGTLRARAEFPNPNKLLRPGMFARLRLSLPTGKPRILIPQRAVQELQGKNFVWVIGPDQRSSQRTVTVGPRLGSEWLIEEGLAAGEQIVIEGIQKLREGAPVNPKTAAQMAQASAAPVPHLDRKQD